jgi:hypothetical protein
MDSELAARRAGFEAGDPAEMSDEAGEHALTISEEAMGSKTSECDAYNPRGIPLRFCRSENTKPG